MLQHSKTATAAALCLAALVAAAPAGASVTIGTAASGNCYPFSCFAGDGGQVYQQVLSKGRVLGAAQHRQRHALRRFDLGSDAAGD
jgi:hypothetical protein